MITLAKLREWISRPLQEPKFDPLIVSLKAREPFPVGIGVIEVLIVVSGLILMSVALLLWP